LNRLKITPSTFQVNEGASINTSIETDFAPGTTLFYKVVGSRVNKKDFAIGRVKGSLKVDANGVASIAHTLRADKATEGAESFTIQVFSDKKMRNLVGESGAVGVGDTSVKATKGGSTDAVTGLSWTVARDPSGPYATIQNDKQYNLSEFNQILTSIGYPTIIGTSGTYEWELGSNYIVQTWRETFPSSDGESTRIDRIVFGGNFEYKNGILTSATIKSAGNWIIGLEEGRPDRGTGRIISDREVTIPDARISDDWVNAVGAIGGVFQYKASFHFDYNNSSYSEGSASDESSLQAYGDGKFFYSNWWENPFDSNLL